MKAVIIVISPINGKRNALTTPISTPTFTIIIENSPRGADNAKAERNDLPFSNPVSYTHLTLPTSDLV